MKRFVVSIGAVLLCAGACDDTPTSHVYLAMRWDAPVADGSNGANGCLEATSALDTVPGETGSLLCAPACLVQTAAGGAQTIYVSTMCGPYPASIADTTGTNASCATALAAWQDYATNGCTCGAPCVPEAGAPGDAGDDGASGDDGAGGDDAGGDDGASGDDAPVGDDGGDAAVNDAADAATE